MVGNRKPLAGQRPSRPLKNLVSDFMTEKVGNDGCGKSKIRENITLPCVFARHVLNCCAKFGFFITKSGVKNGSFC